MTIMKQIKNDPQLRKSFNKLAVDTFGISFEEWYEKGYWTDRYLPYAWVENGKVIANVSVNLIDITESSQTKRYIQLGTVMTDPHYRRQGLAKTLIKEVIKDWQDQSEGIYLFANEKALEFYPKFSFENAMEYQYSFTVQPKTGDFDKLDMTQPKNQALLKHYYMIGNPFSSFSMKDNFSLLMFYCLRDLRDCVYYSKQFNLIVIAEPMENSVLFYEILGKTDASLEKIAASFAESRHQRILLGFTPKEPRGYTVETLEKNHLFITKDMSPLFQEPKMFPLLSHA